MTARTLDRKVQYDDQSRAFPIRTLTPKTPRSYTWNCNSWLDQGSEGACVGFSWTHELNGKPKVHDFDNTFAQKLYKAAQSLDEWPGENYDGTSVLAGAKTVQSLGYIGEYRWAFGLDDLILAVGHAGPAVLGISWYTDMFEPDNKGVVHVAGSVAGGHAILCNGVNIKTKQFRLHNSWSKRWGINGECFISFDDMDRLLHESGEACVPVVRTK